MKTAALVCRLLLGLMFVVFGLNGFLHFIPSPPIGGFVLTFMTVITASHFYILPFGVQVITGLLLIVNRYVPLALVTLAAVLANILAFHIAMYPSGLPMAIFTAVLWFVVSWSIREQFKPLFVQKLG